MCFLTQNVPDFSINLLWLVVATRAGLMGLLEQLGAHGPVLSFACFTVVSTGVISEKTKHPDGEGGLTSPWLQETLRGSLGAENILAQP